MQRFSYTTTTSNSHGVDNDDDNNNMILMDQVRKRTQTWLTSPHGDLTPEDWFGIADDVEFLATHQQTAEAVELTFALMDRLAQEQRVIASLTRAAWVDGLLLQKILQNWHIVWNQRITTKQHHHHDQRQQSSPLSRNTAATDPFVSRYGPQFVLDSIRQYCDVFREAKWSSRVAYFIVSAFNTQLKAMPKGHSTMSATTTAKGASQQPHEQHQNGMTLAPMILDKVLEEWKNGNEDCKPTPELLQAIANAYTSSRIPQRDRKQAALRVQELLETVAQELGHPPDARLLASSINAWALTRSSEGARKAHDQLDQMWHVTRETKENVPKWVWVHALRAAINAWTWSKDSDTLRRVDVLLVRTTNFIESELIDSGAGSLPIWNAGLEACAVSRSQKAAQLATKIFEKVVEPDTRTFYWYIASLVNGGEVEKGEELMGELLQSEKFHIGENFLATVIHGWSRSDHPQKYKRARRLVENIESSGGHFSLQVTNVTYHALLECCANCHGPGDYFANEAIRLLSHMRDVASANNATSMQPDVKSYTSVIKCLSKRGDGKQAEAIFDEMVSEYQKTGDRKLKPDTVLFNLVLAAYSRSYDADALEGAQAFFQKALESYNAVFAPDTYSFTSLVATIARAGGSDHVTVERAKVATNLLNQVRSLYKNGAKEWQTSTPMYNAVMNCWATAGSPEECERTLQIMLQDYKMGNHKALPDIQSFNTFLKSLGSSNREDSAKRAEDVVTKIKDLHRDGILNSGPNVVT